MMNFGGLDWRDRRNLLNQGTRLGPMQYTIFNYSTDAKTARKAELKTTFPDEELLNKFHSIPDPLKKNLGDTIVTEERKKNKTMPPDSPEVLPNQEFYYETHTMDSETKNSRRDFYQSLTGITGLITNFFGAISGAMFHKRAKSPVSQYYDCFDEAVDARERSPSFTWQASNFGDQNKNDRAGEQFATEPTTMNNCRAAVSHCEDKLNAVKNLLSSKTVPAKPRYRSRRPRRVFVEPNSVEDRFEDAFAPEDFISLENDEYVEFFTVPNNSKEECCKIDAPKVKTEIAPLQSVEIVTEVPEISEKIDKLDKSVLNSSNIEEVDVKSVNKIEIVNSAENQLDEKKEIISACEDKMAKLKSLLQEKRKKSRINPSADSILEPVLEKTIERPKKPTKSVPIEKIHDKHFKNPKRSVDKRKKAKLRKNIKDDMTFAHEIDSDDIASSVETLPSPLQRLSEHPSVDSLDEKEYFNEIKGRFHSTSTTESEDSFQIVFTDSPKTSRIRRPSDCESEDSFIVFEESPDSCYTSNDVFGGETSDSDIDSDVDSDESDSGCVPEVCKLSHSLSRTVSDLTDNSLYENGLENDVVDCAVRTVCEVISEDEIKDLSEVQETAGRHGLLVDEARKREKKTQSPKKVSFSTQPPKVHVMRVWAFAARQARAGHWERHALDRERFKRRIADVDMAVSWVLKPQHRSRVMFQRFMPWWNAQKRKELAEKKERERIKKEAEEREKEARIKEEAVKGEAEESDRESIKMEDLAMQDIGEKGDMNSIKKDDLSTQGKDEEVAKASIDKEDLGMQEKVNTKIEVFATANVSDLKINTLDSNNDVKLDAGKIGNNIAVVKEKNDKENCAMINEKM